MDSDGPPLPVVALVASAGELSAPEAVLAGLPSDFRAAVIALQHLSPDCTSVLANILQRSAPLPVRPAADDAVLAAGKVLVAGPGVHTLITDD